MHTLYILKVQGFEIISEPLKWWLPKAISTVTKPTSGRMYIALEILYKLIRTIYTYIQIIEMGLFTYYFYIRLDIIPSNHCISLKKQQLHNEYKCNYNLRKTILYSHFCHTLCACEFCLRTSKLMFPFKTFFDYQLERNLSIKNAYGNMKLLPRHFVVVL